MSQREKIDNLCREAGLGIMLDVADVVADRGDVTPLDVRRYFEAKGVEAVYEQFIGPAIDGVEAAVSNHAGK